MDIAAVGGLLAAVGTLLSVWFAIFTWQRKQTSDRLRDARPEMVEIHQTLDGFFHKLDADVYFSIDTLGADEIKKRLPRDADKSELISYMSDEIGRKSLNRAMTSALLTLNELNQAKRDLERLKRLVERNRQVFPTLCEIARDIANYLEVAAMHSQATGQLPKMMDEHEEVRDMVVNRVNESPDLDTACLAVSTAYTDFSAQAARSYEPESKCAIRLFGLMVETIVSRHDRKLMRTSRKMKRLRSAHVDTESHLNDALIRSEMLKPLFAKDEWIEVVKLQQTLKDKITEDS